MIFCSLRNRVDVLVVEFKSILKELNYKIVFYYGSLVRVEREEIEEILKRYERVIVVLFFIFEIGIDIGLIDLVVLVELLFDMNSFF